MENSQRKSESINFKKDVEKLRIPKDFSNMEIDEEKFVEFIIEIEET